jgi:hypothetical protein
MFRRLLIYAWLSLFGLLAGCANMTTTRSPEADLTKIKTIYVQKLQGEEADIDKLIVARLTAMGYQASSGLPEKPSQPTDATMTYVDNWMWDITMYMIRLTVHLRDGSSGAIIASTESYRPSLQRKSPEAMVEEVLNDLFGLPKPKP